TAGAANARTAAPTNMSEILRFMVLLRLTWVENRFRSKVKTVCRRAAEPSGTPWFMENSSRERGPAPLFFKAWR
ncbi:hypothetical protein ACNJUT_22050, partial [Mycobacterium tuberculosis]